MVILVVLLVVLLVMVVVKKREKIKNRICLALVFKVLVTNAGEMIDKAILLPAMKTDDIGCLEI